MTMFVNIPSRIVEIQQYFVAILTPIFSTFFVYAKVAKAPCKGSHLNAHFVKKLLFLT